MTPTVTESPSAWTEAELRADPDWIFRLDARAQRDLIAAVRRARDPARTLLDYGRQDMDLGTAWPVIEAALRQVKRGRGIALLRGLPRHDVTEAEFELMTWAIGLHAGVARPQGKASQYISQVRNAGTDYRSATGRGYSSDAELDFHTDGADLVALACYNQGASGGVSLVTSAVAVHNALISEQPGLAAALYQPLHFSRQGEQASDEEPFYPNPVYAVADGCVYSKWNRNRVRSAQRLEGVPPLTEAQCAATDALDACLRRPGLMFTMVLEPGDLQLLDNHTMLHSRTAFVDADEPARRRLLYRLWLAPPDGARLPDSWRPFFRSIEPGTVRGGIRGHHHDARCQAFERRQAAAMGMDVAG